MEIIFMHLEWVEESGEGNEATMKSDRIARPSRND
jgi:hypothetical protein